ncbi:unnamed protein product [Ectocarpus sp. 12 AP-2014]
MHPGFVLHLTALPGIAHAFVGGWASFVVGPEQHRQQQHRCAVGEPFARAGSRNSFAGSTRRPPIAAPGAAPRRQQLRLMPNEYEAFFNKASRLGADATRDLAPEERAQRAMEGEKLEDEIIEIATVLREKADEMVAETGAINFEIIQPMIDEIAVLKSKYKVVMGATQTMDGDGAPDADDGEDASSC